MSAFPKTFVTNSNSARGGALIKGNMVYQIFSGCGSGGKIIPGYGIGIILTNMEHTLRWDIGEIFIVNSVWLNLWKNASDSVIKK